MRISGSFVDVVLVLEWNDKVIGVLVCRIGFVVCLGEFGICWCWSDELGCRGQFRGIVS